MTKNCYSCIYEKNLVSTDDGMFLCKIALGRFTEHQLNEICGLWESKLEETSTQTNNNVNHPKHYNSHPSKIECIEIVRHHNFNIGNAIKYLWRHGLKDGNLSVQDLQKAIWYIQDEILYLQSKSK
jgi:hypothetical protein